MSCLSETSPHCRLREKRYVPWCQDGDDVTLLSGHSLQTVQLPEQFHSSDFLENHTCPYPEIRTRCEVVRYISVHYYCSYLIWDHDQWIFILRQKIKQTPQSEGVLLWQQWAAASVWFVVFLCRESPTEFIYVFFSKGAFHDLRQRVQQQKHKKKNPVQTHLYTD